MIGNGGNLYRGFESLSDFAAEVGLLCLYGEVAEWSKAPAWKVGIWGNLYRGFESLSLRH